VHRASSEIIGGFRTARIGFGFDGLGILLTASLQRVRRGPHQICGYYAGHVGFPMFKEIDQILRPDPRIDATSCRDGTAAITPAEQHDWIAGVTLTTAVPDMVVEAFDRARNAFVYTYYVYEFAMLAELQALATVEMALRLRLGSRAPQNGTLWNLAEKAIADNLLSDPPQGPPLKVLLTIMRNELAHGSDHLHTPAMSLTVMEFCAEQINLLFP
jgi:hypothetical protein